jgi:hypothetical protein
VRAAVGDGGSISGSSVERSHVEETLRARRTPALSIFAKCVEGQLQFDSREVDVRGQRGRVIKLETISFDPTASNLMRSLWSRTASTMP